MNKSFNSDGIQYIWDSTSIKLAETCLYKYSLKMLHGWQPLGSSPHLRFGQLYASALEHFHKFIAEGTSREDAIRNVIREAMVSSWDFPTCEACKGTGHIPATAAEFAAERQVQPGLTSLEFDCVVCETTGVRYDLGSPWHSGHNTKTRENLIRTIIWYFEQFADDSCTTVMLADGTAAVEHSFKLPVENGIIFSGHLDRLVEYSGKTYIQDQKTTAATITPRYFQSYNPDSQISGMYPFAGRAVFGLPIKGVMVDAAQIAVGFSRFERGFIFTDDSLLNEWYDDTMYTIEYAQAATRENHFPRNRASCGNYGGCEFRSICSLSPHLRPNFLAGNFQQLPTWDPATPR